MIKILIVDDHPIFRQGLIRIISSSPDMVVVDEADNGQESIDKIKTIDCNLVILDISMPVMNGEEMIAQIRALVSRIESAEQTVRIGVARSWTAT